MLDTAADPLSIRKANFGNQIRFHAPGLKRYRIADYREQNVTEFVAVSITGTSCALSCEHCKTGVLRGMTDLGAFDGSLFELAAELAAKGAKGLLISGGSDKAGRVPLLPHLGDLARIRKELGLALRVHVGIPDEETSAGLGEADLDGAMIDVIGHRDTIRDVYHLNAEPEEFERALERLERHGVPTVPHIIIGLHFGRFLGEHRALEMIARHPPKVLVLVILMPLTGTPMAGVTPPSVESIGAFFETSRRTLPATPIMLGCARPLGEVKAAVDRLAVDAGLNGIAYPAEGIVDYARARELEPHFIDACCGVEW